MANHQQWSHGGTLFLNIIKYWIVHFQLIRMVILLCVLIIIAIPFIIALFSARQYTITRTILINRPQQVVFDYSKLLRNGELYNKWVMTDPGMKKTFTGTDGTVGFIYAWESENKQVGKGEQEITQIIESEKISSEVRFIQPFTGKAQTYMETSPLAENQTQLTWVFTGELNYMMRVIHMLLNLKKALTKDIDTSLSLLKKNLEN